MSFPKYEAYKESGVEWLGEVPEHWEVKPLKHIAEIDNSGCYGTDSDAGEFIRPVATTAQIDSDGNFVVEKMSDRGFSAQELRRYGCNPGDILIVKSSGSAENIISGKAGLVKEDTPSFVFSNFLMRVRHLENQCLPSFLYSLLVSHLTKERIKQMCSTTTYPNLQVGLYTSAQLPCPPLLEQIQIACFLERETACIDVLIAEQQRLIELLKEKRQAVISHAVAKGLDPTAPIKDSGVELLGEVPAHWKVSKLGHYAELLTGFAFPSALFSHDESDTKLLRGANVGISILRWDDTVYWKMEEDDELSKYLMPIGQIIMGMDRPWIGEGMRLAKVSEEDVPCLLLQRVAAITPSSSLNEDYLFNLLWSDIFKHYVEPDLTGVSVPHISPEQILNFQIPLPPTQEQRLICEYINAETSKDSSLIEQSNISVRLLPEKSPGQ